MPFQQLSNNFIWYTKFEAEGGVGRRRKEEKRKKRGEKRKREKMRERLVREREKEKKELGILGLKSRLYSVSGFQSKISFSIDLRRNFDF